MKIKHSKFNKEYHPETLALGFGYDPMLSEGAAKPPVFLTSTFQFRSAEEGKKFFELAYGLREPEPGEQQGLIYSRLNNPNLQIFEERLATWDRTEMAATFASGMAAISTTVFALIRPGDVMITTAPVYGGTHYFLEKILPRYGMRAELVPAGPDAPRMMREAAERVGPEKVRLLFVETPANPSMMMTDIAMVSKLSRELSKNRDDGTRVLTLVDNTFLGPVFQRPGPLGADLVIYSATKFIGGHSDLIAGVVTGRKELIEVLLESRTIFGTMANPFSGWLLLRSLETVSIRMRRQAKSARILAHTLDAHPAVSRVFYPELLDPDDPQYDIYRAQCSGPGSLIAFEVAGGQPAAYQVLDAFEVCSLAVSLGGTETLVEHPMTMTHADVPPEELERQGVTPGLIRISVGIEHLSDLKRDITAALDSV